MTPMADTHLRYPDKLHDRLARQAKRNHRSLNAEIIHLLEKSLTIPPPSVPPPVRKR